MGDWKEVALGEVAELSWGNTKTTKASYTQDGWLAYSASGPDGHLPYFEHDEPGVVISAIGALCGKTWLATGRWSCIKNTMWMRGNSVDADTSFLFHTTRRSDFWPRRGAAQPFISLGDARAVTLELPPMRVQKRIAAVLSAFDELIEINERRIELLEDLARSLYREWFVHFRFPGHDDVEYVESELGLIPEGWEVRSLDAVAAVNRKGIKPAHIPDPFLYLDISTVGVGAVGVPSLLPAAKAPSRARRLACDGDIVWATVRPNRRAHAQIHNPPANLVISTGLAVLSPVAVPPSFLFEYTASEAFSSYLVGRASGSAYPAVRPKDFGNAPVVVPPQSLLENFDAIVNPIQRLRSDLRRQNHQLAATRDLLLPRLVTGKLDISDIDLGVLDPVEAK